MKMLDLLICEKLSDKMQIFHVYLYLAYKRFMTVMKSSFLGEIWLICSIYSIERFDACEDVCNVIDEKKRSKGELEHGVRKTKSMTFANLGKVDFFYFQ